MSPSTEICTQAPPRLTETGEEVLAYHCHRYVGPWLERWGLDRVRIAVGFEGSAYGGALFEVDRTECRRLTDVWDFRDIFHACRHGDGRLHVEAVDSTERAWNAIPVLDRPAMGGQARVILGFVLVEDDATPSDDALEDLQAKASEAICGARRNGVRMFFDDVEDAPLKESLYGMMEHLPEWFGCDHSAGLVMTSSVETMALTESAYGRFELLAERLYWESDGDSKGKPTDDRLVGMSMILGDGSHPDILELAVQRQKADAGLPFQIFRRQGDRWVSADAADEVEGRPFHRLERTPGESTMVLVPLLSEGTPETELLGFVYLAYRGAPEVSSSIGEVVDRLRHRLSARLRYSALYTLSARKLWLVQQARELAVDASNRAGESADQRRAGLIEDVTSMLAHHTEIPSLAIGFIQGTAPNRELRYVHPHGWTKFDELELPVDVDPGSRQDSGVSALSARMGRPFILAGGREEGAEHDFKNYLWVNEESGTVVDSRAPAAADLDLAPPEWARLSTYYKPARSGSYATLAYPIRFADTVFGVITVEVERATSWVWWTGFGGQLFWQMLADELAWAFRDLHLGDLAPDTDGSMNQG